MRALALTAALSLAGPLAAQTELAPVLDLLRDRDRDEAWEVAARYLAAVPASPAHDLRAWCRGQGWRAQALLLRVLGERGELRPEDVDNALQSPSWTVRRAAARALGACTGVHGYEGDLVRLLSDPWAAVRRTALEALHRRGQLDAPRLRATLRDPRLRSMACAVYAIAPEAYPDLLGALISQPDLRDWMLPRLVGVAHGPMTATLQRFARDPSIPASLRCGALLVLRREDWPVDPVALVLESIGGTAEAREWSDRVASLLAPAECGRFLDGIARERRPDVVRERLRIASRAPRGSGSGLLRGIAELPAPNHGDALRCLVALRPAGLVERAVSVLERAKDAEQLLPWIEQVGALVVDHERHRHVLVALLHGQPRVAAAAFRVLVGRRHVPREVLAFAVAEESRAASLTGRLLSLTREVPSGFWVALLASSNARVRWTAAKALGAHARAAPVQSALLRALYAEAEATPRGAMLAALLRGMHADALAGVVDWVLEREDPALDRTLVSELEVATRAWAPRALVRLEGTRFAPQLAAIRAVRGDRRAARELLERIEEVPATRLRRARDTMATALVASDLPRLRRLMESAGHDEQTLPWIREEVVAWLRQRRDLEAIAFLEHLYRNDSEPEVRDAAAAALVERGRADHLVPIVEQWVGSADEDAEGLLLELISALPRTLTDEQSRFLVRLLVAPTQRVPLRSVAVEMSTPTYRGRVEGLFPLLRPTVEGIGRVGAARFRALLIEQLENPALRKAWTSASKAYLLRGLQLAVHRPPAESVLEPVLEWARRLSPRDHDSAGALSLLAARMHQRAGRPGRARAAAGRGIAELLLAAVPLRAVEQIARDFVPSSTGPGFAVLRAKTFLLEAAAAVQANDPPGVAAAVERARLAAREDPGLLRVVERFRSQHVSSAASGRKQQER